MTQTTQQASPSPKRSVFHLGKLWGVGRAQSAQGMTALDVQAQGRPMSELLPWMFCIDERLVVCKDSGLLACFEFIGLDADSAADEQLNNLSYHVERAMAGFATEPLVYWWQVRRRKTLAWPKAEFMHATSTRLDESRRAAMKVRPQFLNSHTLSVLLRAPLGAQKLSAQLSQMVQDDQAQGKSKWGTFLRVGQVLLASFNPFSAGGHAVFGYHEGLVFEAAERFDSGLKSFIASMPSLSVERLTGERLALHLARSCSPASRIERHGLPESFGHAELFMDECMACDHVAVAEGDPGLLTFRGDAGQCLYGRAVTLRDWPLSSVDGDGIRVGGVAPGTLDGLLRISGEVVITLLTRTMERSAAQSFAESVRRYHNNRKFNMKSLAAAALKGGDDGSTPVNSARAGAGHEANEIAGAVSMNQIQLVHAHLSVLCLAADLKSLDVLVDSVEEVAKAANFGKVYREEMHLLSSFAAQVPGNYQQVARWTPVTSANVADVAMLRTIATGRLRSAYLSEHLKKPCDAALVLPTNYQTPFYFDVFALILGHGLFVGPSRAGKTVMMLLLASGFLRYGNSQVICLDKDLSCRVAVLTQGGTYAMLDPEGTAPIAINPLALLREPRNRQWLISWVELLVSQRGFVVDTVHTKEIEEALAALADLPSDGHHLSGLYAHITHAGLRAELRVWVRDEQGALCKYFDNDVDGFSLSSFCGFELGKVLTHQQVCAPFTEYLFYRIDQMLLSQRETGVVRPTMLLIPEVWNLLAQPAYAAKIMDWLKTFAKRHAALWMDTQSVEDITGSSIFAALRDNVPNKVFAANSKATSRSARAVYVDELGLKEEQVQLIAQAVPRRDFLLMQGETVRSIELSLSKFELAVLRSDTNAQIALDRHLHSGHPDWIDRYLKEMSHETN
jgi:type IV secretion system protein TrbE